jgi:hypothetical protein
MPGGRPMATFTSGRCAWARRRRFPASEASWVDPWATMR